MSTVRLLFILVLRKKIEKLQQSHCTITYVPLHTHSYYTQGNILYYLISYEHKKVEARDCVSWRSQGSPWNDKKSGRGE